MDSKAKKAIVAIIIIAGIIYLLYWTAKAL